MASINQTSNDFRSNSSHGRVRETGFYIGIVKGNADPQRMGRLAVYIPEFGGDPEDPQTWYTVGYASPFAGATDLEKNSDNGSAMKEMSGTQKSYGWWTVPPDVNNQVLLCFVNGDTARGYWFGCLYQQFMNHMVPGVPLNRSTKPEIDAENLPPVCEYNRKDTSQNVWDPLRPVFEPLHNGLAEQGLYTDPERGPSTSGARRESPSKVFGWLSPRGNTIHIDDDEENELIRLRTRTGVQLLLHETTGYIYMNSKKGDSWFELSDEGIDMYTKRSINMRAEESINLHADKNINAQGTGAIHSRGGNSTSASETQSTTHVAGNTNTVAGGTSTTDAQGGHARNAPQIRDGSNTSAPTSVQANSTSTPATQNNGQGQGQGQGGGQGGTGGNDSGSGGSGGTGGTGGNAARPAALGDSIANGVQAAGNLPGQTRVGANPASVLGFVNSYASNNNLQGQNVVLSSGLSNNPFDRANVLKQIDTLQNAGANVTLLGTSPNIQNGANNWLQGVAQQKGLTYQPLGALASDGVHPASYGSIYNQIKNR